MNVKRVYRIGRYQLAEHADREGFWYLKMPLHDVQLLTTEEIQRIVRLAKAAGISP